MHRVIPTFVTYVRAGTLTSECQKEGGHVPSKGTGRQEAFQERSLLRYLYRDAIHRRGPAITGSIQQALEDGPFL